jgi:hypothetical protein
MLSKRRRDLVDGMKGRQPATIESAQFPGVTIYGSADLPGGLATVQHLQNITAAQHVFATKPRLKQTWEEMFYSMESQCLFLDCFWWIYLEKFHKEEKREREENKASQSILYDRISHNYVTLLCKPLNPRHRGAIFMLYTDVLCQAIYSAFVQCFSISWQLFDERFKVDLCNLISLWLVGTRPLPDRWQLWNYTALDPPKEFKMIAVEEEEKGKSQDRSFDLDHLLAIDEVGAKGTSASLSRSTSKPVSRTAHTAGRGKPHVAIHEADFKDKSQKFVSEESLQPTGPIVAGDVDKAPGKRGHLTVKGGWKPSLTRRNSSSKSYTVGETLEFQKVLFDIYGHSPLVQHFLRKKDLMPDAGLALLFKRTEISSPSKKSGSTFQEMATKIDADRKTFEEDFDRLYHDQKRKFLQFENRRVEERVKYRRDVDIVLSRKKDVSRLSRFLTLQLLSGDQHKPMKSRQVAITDYLREEMEHITNS